MDGILIRYSFISSTASLYLVRYLRLTHSPLFVDRFIRSLRVCHLEFNKKAVSVGYRSESGGFGGGVMNFK